MIRHVIWGSQKKESEILAARLNEKNLLEKGVKLSCFRTRESTFLQYFESNSSFVFCNNIPGLLKELGLLIYNPDEWRLFIDSKKQNLKCILLHNGNLYDAVPIGHSVILREEHGQFTKTYQNLRRMLGYHSKISFKNFLGNT